MANPYAITGDSGGILKNNGLNSWLSPLTKKRTDLIKKALRKLPGQALRNEIDVTDAWLCF